MLALAGIAGQLQEAILLERSYGAADVPGTFWFATYLGKNGQDKAADLGRGELKGFKGISADRRIVLQWFGVGRNALVVMPGRAVVAANKLTRIMYGNPEYLASKDFEALYRIFQKDRDKMGRHGLMQNIMERVQVAMRAEGSEEARTVADLIRRGTLGESQFGSRYAEQKPKIQSLPDVGRFLRRTALDVATTGFWPSEYARKAVEATSVAQWTKAAREALLMIGKVYVDEGEWLIKSDTFKVPSGSRIIIMKPARVTDRQIRAYLSGGRAAMLDVLVRDGIYDPAKVSGKVDPGRGWSGSGFRNWDAEPWDRAAELLDVVRSSGLDRRYVLRFLDEAKFNRIQKRMWSKK